MDGVDARRKGGAMIKSREQTPMDQPTESAVEGEIRELVRRDVATFRRAPEAESEAVANNIVRSFSA